jgi:hypothetical protein
VLNLDKIITDGLDISSDIIKGLGNGLVLTVGLPTVPRLAIDHGLVSLMEIKETACIDLVSGQELVPDGSELESASFASPSLLASKLESVSSEMHFIVNFQSGTQKGCWVNVPSRSGMVVSLKKCVQALAKKQSFVPFKDSILTRMLQPWFSGPISLIVSGKI